MQSAFRLSIDLPLGSKYLKIEIENKFLKLNRSIKVSIGNKSKKRRKPIGKNISMEKKLGRFR